MVFIKRFHVLLELCWFLWKLLNAWSTLGKVKIASDSSSHLALLIVTNLVHILTKNQMRGWFMLLNNTWVISQDCCIKSYSLHPLEIGSLLNTWRFDPLNLCRRHKCLVKCFPLGRAFTLYQFWFCLFISQLIFKPDQRSLLVGHHVLFLHQIVKTGYNLTNSFIIAMGSIFDGELFLSASLINNPMIPRILRFKIFRSLSYYISDPI